MANIAYTDRRRSGTGDLLSRMLRNVAEVFTNIAECRILRDLSTMDKRTLSDLGLTREQLSHNEGITHEILAHREIGDLKYLVARM
jgi:uncharacterized protein YjiS (DUF1127 family)